ncbi:hypothetical protein D8B26_002310 [Coccidioides posadasii str. Silveira]|uniref:uncharacterized protein n=1 Tax=Coccidioides posadasii (strain RMSCC 757 / Silveira) TaxID=443226 RepID=UPI001BEF4D62|nr:hypothetical protein D8B26_002310 [Coccidioides posadasii str. Silveira]
METEYLSGEELDREIVQLLDDYRFAHAPDFRSRTDLSADDVAESIRKSEAAEDRFSAAFSDRPNWDLARLRDFSSGSYERALEIVRDWARSIVWPGNGEGGLLTQTAATSQACSRQLEQFMESSLWPFVKIVRVYLEAAVLRLGLVLTDLPGFRDANAARVSTTRQYLSNCDHIFVVSGISRAIDDATISNVIEEHVKTPPSVGRTRTPGLTVVCSRAAELNSRIMGRYENEIDTTERRRLENELRLAYAGNVLDWRRHREAEIAHLALFVNARNSSVAVRLRERVPDVEFEVFCVDMGHYQRPFNEKQVKLSGIPTLRRFCHSIPAASLYATGRNFLNISLPSLVNSLEVWYDSGTHARSQPLLNQVSIRDLFGKLDSLKQNWTDEQHHLGQASLRTSYRRNREAIQAAANAACEECLHHEIKNSTPGGQGIELISDNSFDKWFDVLSSALDGLKENARAAQAPRSLLSSFIYWKYDIERIIQEAQLAYMNSLRSLKRDATGGHAISLITKNMAPTYRICARDRGSGVHVRSQCCIHNQVKNTGIFDSIDQEVQRSLEAFAHRTASSLYEQVKGVFEAIDSAIAAVDTADETLIETHPAFFESMGHVLPWAKDFVTQRTQRRKCAFHRLGIMSTSK